MKHDKKRQQETVYWQSDTFFFEEILNFALGPSVVNAKWQHQTSEVEPGGHAQAGDNL